MNDAINMGRNVRPISITPKPITAVARNGGKYLVVGWGISAVGAGANTFTAGIVLTAFTLGVRAYLRKIFVSANTDAGIAQWKVPSVQVELTNNGGAFFYRGTAQTLGAAGININARLLDYVVPFYNMPNMLEVDPGAFIVNAQDSLSLNVNFVDNFAAAEPLKGRIHLYFETF
jgi:hypothetical protein